MQDLCLIWKNQCFAVHRARPNSCAIYVHTKYMSAGYCVVTNHCYAIFLNGLRLPSPSFADDITLLALHSSFFKTFMSICYKLGLKFRYEFNHFKSGIVIFGKFKPEHFESIKSREKLLGDTKVDELYEYKSLGVLKKL